MNTDKLDIVDIFDNDDNNDKGSNDDNDDNDIMIEAEYMNKEEIIQDTYIVDRNDMIIKEFHDIPFLNTDASILKFTEEQAHNEIFNLTESFNFKRIFKEITDIENNSLKDKSIIDTFLRSKWFYPIAKFKKNRLDYDFENIENIETDNYKQTSLLNFLKKLKEFKYSPVYSTDKQNYKLPEDMHVLWEHSINDDTKVDNYINPEEKKFSKSLIWDEEDLKAYIENLWHNYDDDDISVNDDNFLESKRILEYKRMLKNENMCLTGMFINNNSKHYYHLFDIDEYFSKLENIVSFPVDASLNSNNTVKNVQIIAKKNNVLTFKNADNIEELYDLTNPPTNKLLYLKDGGYSYVYSKKDFYDENIIFLTNKYNFLEIAHIIIPDIYDFLTINKSTDYTTINKKLNYFHNTTIEKLHEYSFAVFKNSYKYKPEKRQSTQIDVKDYKSSFESPYDILNKKEFAKTNLITDKKFDDKILTKMDSNMRRFNTLDSFKDKGFDIIYHLHVLKFIKYIVSLKPMENINDHSESFKLKDIYDIDKIKEMKKKYSTNGKTNFDDYNKTINKCDEIKSEILKNFKERISFMNSKHHVPYKSIQSQGNATKKIKDSTYEDVVLNVDFSMYETPTEFEQPQINTKNNDHDAKIILSIGMKVNDSQLEALLTYYRKNINVLESQQDKSLPDKSKMIILFTWVLIFTQIIDKSFIKKELIDNCVQKYSIGGYPINDLEQTDSTEIFKNNKDKSLIGYLTSVFMYKNNVSDIPYQKVMFEIIKRVRDVFKLFPYLKNKLKDVHEFKNSKYKQFEITKSYVKMFKPFNQSLTDIDLSKTKIDRFTKFKDNIFNVTKAIKFKKPIESITIYKPEDIVHAKSKANIKDFNKKEITLDDFIKENDWIDPDTIQAIIYNDKNEYALSEHIEKLFSTYMEINNNSQLRKHYEDAITNEQDINLLLQQNFNVYFSDVSNITVTNKNISYLFKFSKRLRESSIFNDTFESSLRKNIITRIDILKKITESDKRKKQTFVAILLSSLLNIINENFDKDENGNYIYQDINIFNSFIDDSFNHKIKQIELINKDELRRKYNLLRSEERAKERSTIDEMSDENIDLYFAYKKIGLESSTIKNIDQSKGATDDQDVDYGDGDGDFQILNADISL